MSARVKYGFLDFGHVVRGVGKGAKNKVTGRSSEKKKEKERERQREKEEVQNKERELAEKKRGQVQVDAAATPKSLSTQQTGSWRKGNSRSKNPRTRSFGSRVQQIQMEVPPEPPKVETKDENYDIHREANEKFEDCYILGNQLGKGAFSIVKECRDKKTNAEFAVKIITKAKVLQDLHRLELEMKILSEVKHPHIIRLREIFETPETLYIITEKVTGGELFDRIVKRGIYTEKEAAVLVRNMVSAIEYLHGLNIAHRDLKPENLLLASESDDTNVKLADFGLSRLVGQEVMMRTACGTPGYVAPEVLKAQGYGIEVDMWSIGVITYILLCGFPPFYHENIPLLFEAIMKADYDYPAEYWDHISDEAIDFVDSLLVVEPSKRMTATNALKHPWLQGAAPATKIDMKDRMANYTKDHKALGSDSSLIAERLVS